MFRSSATRSILRNLPKAHASRPSYNTASALSRNVSLAKALSSNRPQALQLLAPRPVTLSLAHYATKSDPPYEVDTKAEEKVAQKKLKPHPEQVSADSSVRAVLEESQGKGQHDEQDMLAGIKQDMRTIKDTFALHEVPKESYYLGAAGILPYAATSLSTVYLAFDVNHSAQHGIGYLFSPELASQLLDVVTPIQIGYGAVIISFLGAIHWGLEYAGYGGHHSYRRYMYGVIAPAVAWPTIYMPVETALISQFMAFTFLYFADANATSKGWFPPWYSTYRFVLTFFVGASIVLSLIGRGQIARHDISGFKSPVDIVKADKDAQWEALEKEEMERQKRVAEQEEAEEDGGEEDGEEKEGGKKDGENEEGEKGDEKNEGKGGDDQKAEDSKDGKDKK